MVSERRDKLFLLWSSVWAKSKMIRWISKKKVGDKRARCHSSETVILFTLPHASDRLCDCLFNFTHFKQPCDFSKLTAESWLTSILSMCVCMRVCVCVLVCLCMRVGYHLEEVMDWPENPLQLGQVSGLALDSDNNLVIFQRGDHQWGVK